MSNGMYACTVASGEWFNEMHLDRKATAKGFVLNASSHGVNSVGEQTADLHAAAKSCLDAAEPAEKLRLTHAAWRAFRQGELPIVSDSRAPEAMIEPGRPARPALVAPRQLAQRGLGTAEGRAALVHAVAHIEFNAIKKAVTICMV